MIYDNGNRSGGIDGKNDDGNSDRDRRLPIRCANAAKYFGTSPGFL